MAVQRCSILMLGANVSDNRMHGLLLFSPGAVGYYETSALTGAGVMEAMNAGVRAVLTRESAGRRRRFVLPWKR